MELQALILSLLILTLVVSNTDSRSLEAPVTCATTCTEPANIGFAQGYSHEFMYTANVLNSFSANTDDSSSTNIDATILVDVLSPCEYVLRITSAELRSTSVASRESLTDWSQSLQRNPLHFSWQNGGIPNICASNDDPVWVLNIKRGILSTLQVSTLETAEAIKETDVTGTCESSYSVSSQDGNRDVQMITKRKNYDTCEGREKHLLFSHFTPYSSESPRQNFVHSSQTCTQTIVYDRFESTECTETHVFRPFSNEESGAQTKIRQSLEWIARTPYRDSTDTLTIANVRNTDLVFEKEDEDTTSSRDILEVQTLFNDLCTIMDTENYDQVGKGFTKLVFLLRRLDVTAIEQVDSMLNGVCPRRERAFRTMFKDALQWCVSEGCVVYAARLIARGPDSVPSGTAKSWLNGMTLMTKPTTTMLTAVMEIVESGIEMEKSYLTAGTIIHRLCEASSKNCLTDLAIRRALATFEEKLGTNCRTTSDDQKQEILFSLRALGNAGRTNSISTLASCASEVDNDVETRIGAIQTFRRMPCQIDRSALKRMMLDYGQDSEIRIASYMSLMKCPTPSLIQELVIMLDDGESQQVTSFVWSHLKQIMESKDPLKGYMKPLLLETAFAKSHDLDPRKYSKYYEASVFSEEMNAGATVESSVIWSPKSFVPRSADIGLSLDVFGQAVNLFEIGGRVEGMEQMVQKMLASEGFMRNNPLSELLMGSDDDTEEDADEEEIAEPRVSRSPDSQRLREHRNEFTTEHQKDLERVEPNGNWYLRVFGNEMNYGTTKTIRASAEAINMRTIFAQLAQNGEYHYHDDTMLMNSAHVLPTGVGLPLTIAFNGSASIDVNVNGNMDVRGLFNSPPNLAINGAIEPRAVVVVSGTMSIDAHATKTGIATETTAITSMNLGGTASIVNGREFSVRIDAPYRRNTLFQFKHSAMKIQGEEMEEFGQTQPNSLTTCSEEKAGQRLCLARPRNVQIFPTSGPIEMSAYFQKMDNDLSYYKLTGSYDPVRRDGEFVPSSLSVDINMNTPESSVDRNTNINFNYDLIGKTFELEFNSPGNSMSLTGDMQLAPTEKRMNIHYRHNDDLTTFSGVVVKTISNQVTNWTTETTLTLPSRAPISGRATATIDPSRHLSTIFLIENLYETPVIFNMTLQDQSNGTSNRMSYHGDGKVAIPGFIDTGGNFDLKFLPRSDSFKLRLAYQFGEMNEETIVLNHKRRNKSTTSKTLWEAEQKFAITQYPFFNHHIQLMYNNTGQNIASMVKFEYGRHAGHEGNKKYILLNESLSYFDDGERKELNATGIVDIPPADITYTGSLNHVYGNGVLDSSITLGAQRMHLLLQDNTPINGLLNKALSLRTPTHWGLLLINKSLVETSENVYIAQGMLKLGEAKGLSFNGTCELENLSNRKRVSIVVDGAQGNALTAESLLTMESSGYRFENSITSIYNNLIQFNVNNTRSGERGCSCSLLFQHEPTKYLKATVEMNNNDDGTSHRSIRLDFNTPGEIRRFMQLQKNDIDQSTWNTTISFDTDFPLLSFNNLAVSAEASQSNGRSFGSLWLRKNNNEIVGVDSSFMSSEGSDSKSIDVTLNGRQRICETMPNLDIQANIEKTSDRYHVNANVRSSERSLIAADLSMASDRSRIEGSLSHGFDGDFPTPMNVLVTKGENDVDMTLTYTKLGERKELSMRLVKNSKYQASFTLHHDDPVLSELRIPSDINSVVNYGTRSSDNGKGIWMTSSVNTEWHLHSELMWIEDDMTLSYKLEHNVEELQIPSIDASVLANVEGSRKNIRATLNLDHVPAINLNVQLSKENKEFEWFHNTTFLSSLNVPQSIRTNLRKDIVSIKEMEIVYNFNLDQKSFHVALSTSEDTATATYDSSFPIMAGSVVMKLTTIRHGYKLKITKGEQNLRATIEGEIGTRLSCVIRQDIFEQIIPRWPRKVSASISKTNSQMELAARYNDNSFDLTTTNEWSADLSTGSTRLSFVSGGPDFRNYAIPRSMGVEFSYNNRNRIYTSLRVTLDEEAAIISSVIDVDSKSLTLGFTQDIDYLSRAFNVPESLHVEASMLWTVESSFKAVNMTGGIVLNGIEYAVYLRRSIELDEMPMQSNITFGHNIMQLYELGVPFEITSNSEVHCSALDGEARAVASFATELIRVNLNDAGNRVTKKNAINMSADIGIFGKKLTLSVFHDFPVEAIPRLMKLELGVANSVNDPKVIYKSFSMGVTRDSVKETATFTLNMNKAQEGRETLLLSITHNATWFYQYGIPKDLSISFARRSQFDADIGFVYDTMKKSVGVKFDYHGPEKKVILALNHNFQLVEDSGIPKNMGLEIAMPINDHRAEFEIKSVFGPTIKDAHFTVNWDMNEGSVNYKHHQNVTTDDVFPEQLSIRHNTYTETLGFSTRVARGSKYAIVSFEIRRNSEPTEVRFSLMQSFVDPDSSPIPIPRLTEVNGEMTSENRFDVSLRVDRTNRLTMAIVPWFDQQEWSGSVQVENWQDLVATEIFPQHITLYANASYGEETMTYLQLARTNTPRFEIGLKYGLDIEGRRSHIELTHSQENWSSVLPRRVQVDTQYSVQMGNTHMLTIDIIRGQRSNQVTLTSNYAIVEGATVYANFYATHDFEELDVLPFDSAVSFLVERIPESFIVQANATLDDQVFVHSLSATYNTDNGFASSFDVSLLNHYLNTEFNIPPKVEGSFAATWEDSISVAIMTIYGDNAANVHLFTDQETRAEFNVSQNWMTTFQQVNTILTRSASNEVSLVVIIDGERKDINLSGNWEQNNAQIQFSHDFDMPQLPNRVMLAGNYRLSPDYFVSLNATVDDQQHTFEGGFNKLENGFHVTTTVLNNVRSVTLRRNVIPGGFSLEIDHSVPELLNYIPGSVGVRASMKVQPQYNMSISVRKEDVTQKFSAEVDTKGLQFTLKHDFTQLPIPRSITVNLMSRSSPLTCEVRVTINDMERTVRATFDSVRMIGEFFHSIPELDPWFVARNVIVGLKRTTDPVGGELYLSIDGLERRVGGSFNMMGGTFNLYQALPETEHLPRNITLKVVGSLNPLSGNVVLTMDEIERSVAAEINPRRMLASVTFGIPETEPYIPRHLSISGDFDNESGHVTFSFIKNGRNQTVSATTDIQNGLTVSFEHDVAALEDIPSPIIFQGDIEENTGTMQITLGEKVYSLSGELILGVDNWYGARLTGGHNNNIFTSNYGIKQSMELQLKGRKNNNAYEMNAVVDLLRDHVFSASASVTPTIKKRRMSLEASYSHDYDTLTRSVTATISASNKRGIGSVFIEAKQTQPLVRKFAFDSSIEIDPELYQYVYSLHAAHNLPELDEIFIPETINIERAALRIVPEEKMVQWEGAIQIEDETSSLSGSIAAHTASEKMGLSGNMEVESGGFDKSFSFSGLFTQDSSNPTTASYKMSIVDQGTGITERNDNVVFSSNMNSNLPTASLTVDHSYLNAYGIPKQMELSLNKYGVGINKHWAFNFSIDGMPFIWKLDLVMQKSPLIMSVGTSLDCSVSYLQSMNVPQHLLAYFDFELVTSETFFENGTLRLEYNDMMFEYNEQLNRNTTNGDASYSVESNIPQFQQWLGASRYDEEYWYATNDQRFYLEGHVTKDNDVFVANYSFDLNLETKEFTYNSRYNNDGYDVIHENINTDDEKRFLLRVSKNGQRLVNIDVDYTPGKPGLDLSYHLFGIDFDIDVSGSKTRKGYSGNLQATIGNEAGYSTTLNVEPVNGEGLIGHRMTLRHEGENTLNAELTYGFDASYRTGGISYEMSGLPQSVEIELRFSTESMDFVATAEPKRLEVHLSNDSEGETTSLSGRFHQRNVELFGMAIEPRDIVAEITHESGNTNIVVTADREQIIHFTSTPTSSSLEVNTIDRVNIINSRVLLSLRPTKSITITANSDFFGFDISMDGSLTALSKNTGKTSLIVEIRDRMNNQRFYLALFALPAFTYDAEDFSAGLNSSSTFRALPFQVSLGLHSNYKKTLSQYIGKYFAGFNNQNLNIDIDSTPNVFNFQVTQPWLTDVPAITINFVKRHAVGVEQFDTAKLNLSWSNLERDRLHVLGKMRYAGTGFFYAVQVDQPSALLGFENCGATIIGDLTEARFGFNSNLGTHELGVNVSYTGDLPQLTGTHNLIVEIAQPICMRIPSHFRTTGDITISSTQYSSEWKIISGQEELVVFDKHYRSQDQGISIGFLWKQSFFSNVPMSYFNMQANHRNVDNEQRSEASLQIDDMPEISGRIISRQDVGNNNQTLNVYLNSGPLPMRFRVLSLTSWYNMETGRESGPKLCATLELDNEPYHFYMESRNVQSNTALRSTNAVKIAHPLNLQIFGQRLANNVEVETTLVQKGNKGSKLIVKYNTNLLENPLNLTTSYRLNDGTNLLTVTGDVESDAKYKIKVGVTSDSVTITAKCPEKHINSEIVLNGRNTAERFEVGGSAKNYESESVTGSQRWKASFAYDKNENTIEIVLASPTLEQTTLRGDLSQVLSQMKQMIRTLTSEAASSRVRFLKGMNVIPKGHNFYVGFEVEGDASYTLHMVIQTIDDDNYAALQIKKNFELEAEVVRANVKLMDNRLVQLKLSANPVMMNFVRKTIEILDTEATRKINWLADNLIEGLASLKTVIVGNDKVEAAVNGYVDVAIAKVNNCRNNAITLVASMASDSTNKFSLASLASENGVRNAITSLFDVIESGKSIILRPFTQVFDQYFGVMLNKTNRALVTQLQPVIAMLRKINAGELLIDLIEEATQKSFEFVMVNGEACFVTARQPLRDLLYVDSTHVIINIPLAVEVEELKPMPSLEDIKNWLAQSALAMTINNGMEKLYSYVDKYYQARAIVYMPRDEMLPPFKGHAFVSGFRHFSTFDKRHYDFSSGCASSHVLAADMRDNNFTVTLTYADQTVENSQNSIDVIVENKRVTVYENQQVKVNGRTKELPIDLEVVSVMLEGNVIHVRRNAGDLDVACDFTKKLCTIDISPYYFGATAGMAGVYNNEPMDDFKTPRSVASTPTELAAEWESSSTLCTDLNAYRPCASNNIPTQCTALFSDSNSPLRPCFSLVDTAPFMKMCRDDVCGSTDSKTSCAAVHAYIYRCKIVGARVQPPPECVECSSVSRSGFDASRPRETTVAAMDMVFVVEQGSCFSASGAIGSLKKFMKKLTSSVNADHMRNTVQYRLVGYGGPGARAMPSTLTIRNKQSTKKTGLLMKVLKKVQLSTEPSHVDTLGAISYATQLPFRAGAKPVIVVISCDSCRESEVSYNSVERQIRKQGIVLHHLPQRAIVAGSSSKSMFGFDSTNAFSKGSDVSSSLIKPNKGDMCEPLATVTGGSVWSGAKMIENNSAFHTKFSDYLVSQVGRGQSQTCTCEMNEMGVPTSVCSP